jgi:8-oxo-dGTP pyrophosphatase MutT (NUDIX family)
VRFDELKSFLAERLREPLPGPSAQLLLAPRPRRNWQPGVYPEDCRPGAALLLLYPVEGRVQVLLTERNGDLQQHAGQVSLPGGAVEEGETIARAALREAREEVGLDGGLVRVLGCLTPLHIPVSGFVLHPVVGVAQRRPDLTPQPEEVARVLEIPLAELADPGNWSVEQRERRGRTYTIPWFDARGPKLWGATAMVLAEFFHLLGASFPEPPEPPAPGVDEATMTNDREVEPRTGRPEESAMKRAELLMTTWDDGEAALVSQILENAGIPTQVVSDVPHSVYPLSVDGLGEVRILVPAEKLEQARALLAEHERQGRESADEEGGSPSGGEGEERP